MPIVMPFASHAPRIASSAFVAENAVIIGDVVIEDDASIWFGAVLRGDVGPIRIGPRSNIQDLACLHTTGGVSSCIIGSDVTVGHSCILHGCQVGSRSLIGMGSILLDNAEIGEDCVVGAGSMVTARTQIPSRSLVMGRPARVLREAKPEEMAMGPSGAATYQKLALSYRSRCP